MTFHRNLFYVLIVSSLALSHLGCVPGTDGEGNGDGSRTSSDPATTTEAEKKDPLASATETAAKELGEAGAAITALATSSKEEVEKKVSEGLEEMEQQLAELKARSGDVTDEVRAALDRRIRELDGKVEELKSALGEFRSASGDAWKDLREGLGKSYDEVETAVLEAASQFRESEQAGNEAGEESAGKAKEPSTATSSTSGSGVQPSGGEKK